MSRLFAKELERIETPQSIAEIIIRRMKPLLKMWPIHINHTMLEQLVLSAYLQGAVDLYSGMNRRKP